MKQSFPEQCGRVQSGVLVVFSMILIWLPTLDSFLHLDKSPISNENRALEKFPEFQSGFGNLREYIAGLEQYYNDHFGFRNRLIRWDHKWKHGLFKDKYGRDDILVGHDGWLFYSSEHMIESLQGFSHFDHGQLTAWQRLLENRRDWCVQHGSAYIFVITPDKESIYPEYLPDWLLQGKKSSRLDQFIAYMKVNSTVPVLDLRPALLEAKTNGILYLLTDSHWNNLGAFVGYQTLIKKLSGELPGLKPLSLDTFDQKLVSEQGQDLARLLGNEQSTIETANVTFLLKPPLKPLTVILGTNLLADKWTPSKEPVYTVNPQSKRKVILFRDSFANAWIPFLGYDFNKVIYIWKYNWDIDFLEQQNQML